jgi:GT2 family glycosyltransferase
VFFEVGCLDENLSVAYNDIDLCMRLADHGYRIVWTPFAELFHCESASRGYDTTPEKQAVAIAELDYLCRSWGSLLETDPFRNPNVIYGWDTTTLATPPRRQRPWFA